MSSLKNKATSAIAWDLGGTLTGQLISLIISVFLARLLEPAQFGLVGMALVFISISQVFADLGFASALVQHKNNSSLTYSSVFYINILAGVLLCVAFQLVAPIIGQFYNNAEVTSLVRWLSLGFVLSSFNIVQRTILVRDINFKKLTFRNLISQCVGGVIGITLAFRGWGVYALVAQNLSATFFNTLFLWKVTQWYPKLEFSWIEVRKLTKFSAYIFLAQSLNQISKRMDVLIVGKLFNPATLGFYTRAESLNSLVTKYSSSSLAKVFFPVLSQLQDDDEKFKRVFFQLIHFIAFVSFAITGVMILAGEDIILILFGKKWLPSVHIFQVLAIKAFVYPISSIIISSFLAKGKSKENFWYGNIRKAISLSTLVVAIFWGFEPFLWAIVAVDYISWLFNNFVVTRSLNISFKEQMNAVIPYLLIFVGCWFATDRLFSLLPSFLFVGVIQAGVYGILFLLINRLVKTRAVAFLIDNGIRSWQNLKSTFRKQ